MVSERIQRLVRESDAKRRKQMISEYMSELGKKSAEVNKRKGPKYYREKALKRWEKYRKAVQE
jgi:hypothetical protein